VRGTEPGIDGIGRRFGLRRRTHRIGGIGIRVDEIERVDDMVAEVYPDAVSGHGDAPVWMITWPAAMALAEHLVHGRDLAGARVLELGCGTAAPGIAAAAAGADVVVTDYDPLALEMARHNLGLNGCAARVERLDWYRPELSGRFDLVIGSEIVYFEKHFPALLAVLARYAEPAGRILLSDQGRPQVASFLALCRRAGYSVRDVRVPVHLEERSLTVRISELRASQP
jgi:predicted nicotinamide N-methyase